MARQPNHVERTDRAEDRRPTPRWARYIVERKEDGGISMSPVLPVFLGLAAVVLLCLVFVSQCTVETAKNVTGIGEEPVPTVPVATPSFESYTQPGCEPVATSTLSKIDDSMRSPRIKVGMSSSFTAGSGEFIAVSIVWDDRRVESPAAVFYRDREDKLWAVSSDARDLTELPDGREPNAISSVTDEALAAENCIS